MARTAVNVVGDFMVSCVVAKNENEIDTRIYQNPPAGLADEELDFDDFNPPG